VLLRVTGQYQWWLSSKGSGGLLSAEERPQAAQRLPPLMPPEHHEGCGMN